MSEFLIDEASDVDLISEEEEEEGSDNQELRNQRKVLRNQWKSLVN